MTPKKKIIVVLLTAVLPMLVNAQKLKITDFVLFGGSSNCVNCVVQIGASTEIKKGDIGSYSLIKSGTNIVLGGNIHSGGKIQLGNNIEFKGNLTVANTGNFLGNTIEIGNKFSLKGI